MSTKRPQGQAPSTPVGKKRRLEGENDVFKSPDETTSGAPATEGDCSASTNPYGDCQAEVVEGSGLNAEHHSAGTVKSSKMVKHVKKSSAAKPGDETKGKLDKEAKNASTKASKKISEASVSEVVSMERGSDGVIKTGDLFDECSEIPEPIKEALKSMELTRMTMIQSLCIPRILEGRDVLGAAETGSGKTLAFVIPGLTLLWRMKAVPRLGTLVLVLVPTRELALQIFEVAKEAGSKMTQTIGCITGGTKKKTEEEKLGKGINFLIATPGRLLDHMRESKSFKFDQLKLLVLDEADRILEIGFEREVNEIIRKLPSKHQTTLFSATTSAKIEDLVRLSMHKPVLVKVSPGTSSTAPGPAASTGRSTNPGVSTVAGLVQGFVLVDNEKRLPLLFKLLKTKLANAEKVMVFFSSCNSAQWHEDLFNALELKCFALHGRKKQAARNQIYKNFLHANEGVLLCTNVAARGLDFPNVHTIIQYDPPDDIREYIHRVGRTARGEGSTGSSILFLLPQEVGFLKILSQSGLKPKEYTLKYSGANKHSEAIAKLVRHHFFLNEGARKAYTAFMLAYQSHALKDVFDTKKLKPMEVAKSFGLDVPPRVTLSGRE